MKIIIGIFVCAYFCISVTKGSSESDLRKSLFEHYDKLVRPVKNSAHVIPVRVNLYPVAIKDVDVKDSVVKLESWLFAEWHDEYLMWEPSEHNGIQALRLPATEVWRPDLALYSAASDNHLMPTVMTNVIAYHNGTVLWVPPFDVKTRCNETEGPTDGYRCVANLGSWTYDVTLLDLQHDVTDALERSRESFYDTNEKWRFESITASTETKYYTCCVEGYNVVKFDMVFKRRSPMGV